MSPTEPENSSWMLGTASCIGTFKVFFDTTLELSFYTNNKCSETVKGELGVD